MRPKAAIDVTAVISPRAHERWMSLAMMYARMNGATAAASSSHRRIGWTSKHDWLPRSPSMLAKRLAASVPYQGRKTLRASSAPPSTPMYSLRCSRAATAAPTLYRPREGEQRVELPRALAGEAQVQAVVLPGQLGHGAQRGLGFGEWGGADRD